MSLSIGIFFSLMIAGLASVLPSTLDRGLRAQGVPAAAAMHASHLPPVSTLFSALLGYNPIRSLLKIAGVLHKLPARNVAALTNRQYFPHLISGPFHHGLIVVFSAAIAMSVAGALISAFRGRQFYYADPAARAPAPAGGAVALATAGVSGASVNETPGTGNGSSASGAIAGGRAGNGRAAGSQAANGSPANGGAANGSAANDDAANDGAAANGGAANDGGAQPAGAGGGAGPDRRPAVRAPRPDDTKL
jgi:hypothetical protein